MSANNNFYAANKNTFYAFASGLAKHLADMLYAQLPKEEIEAIMRNTRNRFVKLLPNLPYIGESNPLTRNLAGAAYEMGFFAEMQKTGMELRKISFINQSALESYMRSSLTPQKIKEIKKDAFSQAVLQRGAFRSQKRAYPGDWVFTCVLPKAPETFDTGIDYTECGIVKLCAACGYKRFAPYLCLNDYPIHKVLGVGLQRTKTLANGHDCCDFRITLNSDGPGLIADPELLPEFQKKRR